MLVVTFRAAEMFLVAEVLLPRQKSVNDLLYPV